MLTLLAAGISGIGGLVHGYSPWRSLLALGCALAALGIVASLGRRVEPVAAQAPGWSLLLMADGSCRVIERRLAPDPVGVSATTQPASFEFGWHNARQARVRCRLADGASREWRVYRSRLSRHDWRQLCRWLVWQARAAVRA